MLNSHHHYKIICCCCIRYDKIIHLHSSGHPEWDQYTFCSPLKVLQVCLQLYSSNLFGWPFWNSSTVQDEICSGVWIATCCLASSLDLVHIIISKRCLYNQTRDSWVASIKNERYQLPHCSCLVVTPALITVGDVNVSSLSFLAAIKTHLHVFCACTYPFLAQHLS